MAVGLSQRRAFNFDDLGSKKTEQQSAGGTSLIVSQIQNPNIVQKVLSLRL
jgi:hypothetical protein